MKAREATGKGIRLAFSPLKTLNMTASNLCRQNKHNAGRLPGLGITFAIHKGAKTLRIHLDGRIKWPREFDSLAPLFHLRPHL